MKKTLITGTNGFLANKLISHIEGDVFGISRSDNHKATPHCTTFYGSILDLEFVKRILVENDIDTVYHLAAQSIVRIANTNPLYALQDNIIGTATILEAVRQINPNIKVICASSDKCYGEHKTLPYLEDFALKSGDVYSTSKACGDLVAQSYHKSYGLNINIVRSANIYGGGDMNLSRIIPNTITRILRKEKPTIYSGVWDFKRELIHVDDVCAAYKFLSENGKSGEAYNVGTGQVYKVGDIVEKICEILEWTEGVEVIQKNFPEITTQFLSSQKINNIGWDAKISLEDGLMEAINWYKIKNSK